MATLTIKDPPDESFAADATGRDTAAELEEIRAPRGKTEGLWLTDEILETAKNEGRP